MSDPLDYPSPIALAIGQIRNDFGVKASVTAKDKSLLKWGYDGDSGNSGFETVQNGGGTETLLTTNAINVVDSTSASDTGGIQVTIEGHYLTATGDLVFVVQTVALTGTTAVTLPTPLARCSRMYISGTEVPVGEITVNANEGGTVYNRILAGETQSEKCATSMSYRDYFILTHFSSSVLGGNNAKVEFEGEVHMKGGVWRPQIRWALNANQVTYHFILPTPIVVPANADLRMRYSSDIAGTRVSGFFGGVIAIDEQYRLDGTPDGDPLPAAA